MTGTIQYDKKLHFLINFFIVFLLSFVDIIFALFTSFVISFSKEFYDEFYRGHFDWKDILADFAGAVLGILIVLLCL